MAYCNTTNVAALNSKRTYNTSSKPTSAQVTSMIAMIYYEMNARLISCGAITTALTTTTSTAYKYLRHINSLGAAGLIEESAFMGGNKQESEHSNSLYEMYEKRMTAIENKPGIIAGMANAAVFSSLEQSDTSEQRSSEPFERSVNKW